MTHPEIVQSLLDIYEVPRYLEVGVFEGKTLRQLEASEKIGIDPEFAFDRAVMEVDPRCTLHEVSSDEYFGRIATSSAQFEVIFLDGLHTFEQTLRDFINALAHLAPGGVIVVDDVTPISHLAATPDPKRFQHLRQMLQVKSGAWMGDVFRLVYFLETFFQQITFRTIAETDSQLVAWRATRERVPERTVAAVAGLSFEDMLFERESYSPLSFEAILDEVRAQAGAQPAGA